MRLTGATILDFDRRTWGHLCLDAPVTLLYGINGAGKTTVLDNLALLFGENPDWASDFHFGLTGLYLHAEDGLEHLTPLKPDLPISRSTTATVFARSYPTLANTVDPETIAEELHRGSRLFCARFPSTHPTFAYVDSEATTLAQLRSELDERVRTLRLTDSDALDRLREGPADDRPDELYDAELLWFLAPSWIAQLDDDPDDRDPDWLPHATRLGPWDFHVDCRLVRLRAEAQGTDPDAALTEHLRQTVATYLPTGEPFDEPPEAPDLACLQEDLQKAATKLGSLADRTARQLLHDIPSLRARVLPPQQWIGGRVAVWEALAGLEQEAWLPLASLSTAERRAARLGIDVAFASADPPEPRTPRHRRLSLDGLTGRAARRRYQKFTEVGTDIGTVLLIDEPEQGLHSLAQRRLAGSIGTLGTRVICASHSPAFLDSISNVVHVQRTRGIAQLDQLTPIARSGLDATWAQTLGLTVPELLQVVRVIVLVEGEHDAALLGELLGDELAEARAFLLPMSGAKALAHVAEARWLFELSEARVVVLLDGLDGRRVDQIIGGPNVRGRRKGELGDGDRRRIRRSLEQLGFSGRLLAALLDAAVDLDRLDRIAPYGLRRKDIIEYLPVGSFLSGQPDWRSAFRTYADDADRRGEPHSGTAYKSWMRAQGAPISTGGIREVARRVVAGEVALDPAARTELDELLTFLAGLALRAT